MAAPETRTEILADPDFTAALASYKTDAWMTFVDYLMHNNSGYEIFGTFADLIRFMPPSLKSKVYRQIQPKYASLAKLSIDPRVPYAIAPKRAIDALISLLNHPHAYFRNQRTIKNPKEIYVSYIRNLQPLVLSEKDGYGLYSGADLIRVYSLIQKEMRTFSQRHPELPKPTLFIAGSFPNGRAHLQNSDIDASLQPRNEELISRIQIIIRESLGASGLDLSLFNILYPGHLAWNSQVNPINVFITPDTMELWIYPVMKTLPHQLYLTGWPVPPDIYQLQ